MEGFFNGMRLVLEVQRLNEALEIFLLRCIPCGLTLQEDDVVVKSKNPVILIDEVIQLSEVSLQTFALFDECLKHALVVQISHNPIHRKLLSALILIVDVVRKSDQDLAIGQVGDQPGGGGNAAAAWDGINQP